jgi:acyl-CoA thioesterase-1
MIRCHEIKDLGMKKKMAKMILLRILVLVLALGVWRSVVAQVSEPASIKPVLNESTQLPTKVLVLGDSLSAAYRLPVEQGWVAMLEQYLTEHKMSVSIANASISGATTAAGLKVLPSALKEHAPDIVVLALGANDGLQGKPIPYIEANLSQLIQMSQGAGARVLLLGVRIPPNYGSAYAEPFFQQYQSLSERFTTELVPFFLDGAAGNTDFMMDDGKHPNAEGQKVVLSNVLPAVEAMLR